MKTKMTRILTLLTLLSGMSLKAHAGYLPYVIILSPYTSTKGITSGENVFRKAEMILEVVNDSAVEGVVSLELQSLIDKTRAEVSVKYPETKDENDQFFLDILIESTTNILN